MMIKWAAVAILFVAGASALPSSSQGGGVRQWEACTPTAISFPPVENVTIQDLAEKKWYVHEVFVTRPEDVTNSTFNCYAQKFTMWETEDDVIPLFDEVFTDIANGLKATNVSVITLMTDAPQAVWMHWGYASRDWYGTTTYTHTDLATYGVMHWCPGPNATHNYERVMTFTSSPARNESLLGELKGMVAELGFPTEYVIRYEHHPDCDYVGEHDK